MRTSTHDTILPLDRRRKSAVVHRGAGAARPAACRHLAPRDGPSADPSGGAQHSRSAARPAGLRGWRKCASTVAPWTTSVCGAMGAARRELLGSASGSHAARHAPEVRPARRAEGSCAAAVARAGGSGRPRHTQKERRRRLQPASGDRPSSAHRLRRALSSLQLIFRSVCESALSSVRTGRSARTRHRTSVRSVRHRLGSARRYWWRQSV